LKDFFLGLEAVYEVLIETEVYRRAGKVPLQELKASLAKEARKVRNMVACTCAYLMSNM
jgi:hypothetical protein